MHWTAAELGLKSLDFINLSVYILCPKLGEQENIDKFTKRLVKVTKQHNDECKKLLAMMGVPYIEVKLTFALLFLN